MMISWKKIVLEMIITLEVRDLQKKMIHPLPQKQTIKVTPSRTPISLDLTQKILGDLKLDYDVVEDLKKMTENIVVFKLCKIAQLREQLRDALQHIQGPQDVVIGN